ncbi:GTP-binding protein [Granulicella sp. WH15]|nr:GTP-binding protein [Granulicella sp. WH15]
MKGVLSLKGDENRFVFQGVHMLFDERLERPWKNAERRNQLVFIGHDLDRNQLNEGSDHVWLGTISFVIWRLEEVLPSQCGIVRAKD